MAKQLSASQLINTRSAGISCSGMYLSTHEDKIFKGRRPMLDATDEVELLGSKTGEVTYDHTFTTEHESDIFLDKVQNIGGELAGKANVGYFFFKANMGHSSNKSENKTISMKSQSSKKYVSAIKYQKVSVGTVNLYKEAIRFNKVSQERLSEIQDLIINNKNCESVITKFFEEFGTHFMFGSIELGGIMITKAVSSFSSDRAETETMQMVKDSVNSFFDLNVNLGNKSGGIGSKITADKLKTDSLKKYDSSKLEKIELSHWKKGGPVDEDNLREWKRGLKNDNTTWHVIEKPCDELTPIWVLVNQEKNTFKHWKKLSTHLQQVWEKLISEEKKVVPLVSQFRMIGLGDTEARKGRELLSEMLRNASIGAENKNMFSTLKLNRDGDQWVLPHLQKKQLDSNTVILQYNDIFEVVKKPYQIYFTLLKGNKYVGEIHIELDGPNPERVRHMMALATGVDTPGGVSWATGPSGFDDEGDHGWPGECIACGGYRTSTGELQDQPLWPVEDQGPVTPVSRGQVRGYWGQESGFWIVTRDYPDCEDTSPVIGRLSKGLEVLTAALAKGEEYVEGIRFSDVGIIVQDKD